MAQNRQKDAKVGDDDPHPKALTGIRVGGFKSLLKNTTVELRPLTVVAGPNSAGKSSIMQPLLLLKQTLEASYDPGALLINGPNVRFTSADQLMSKCDRDHVRPDISIGCGFGSGWLDVKFSRGESEPFELKEQTLNTPKQQFTLVPGMSAEEVEKVLPDEPREMVRYFKSRMKQKVLCRVRRTRCFLEVQVVRQDENDTAFAIAGVAPAGALESLIQQIIHVPGLRGNPERTYPVTAMGETFPGTFEKYVASVIAMWQSKEKDKLEALGDDLVELGLTWKVLAQPLNDTEVELKVGRLTKPKAGGARDLVSIADVGFGVSQTLPVLVALRAAKAGNLVYLEQPEIHLHPRAQLALANVIVNAINRGVRVIVETHSALLLLRLQTLVADNKIDPSKVGLVWFTRDDNGATQVDEGTFDNDGAFGTWPVDFGSVILRAEADYLNVVESQDAHRGS
jgi:predicted ATPase